jgi:hypothetical protein
MRPVTTSDLSLLDAEQLRELLVHSQREVEALKRLNEKLTICGATAPRRTTQ